MEHHDEPSACSCRLPPGRWGQGGWHWGRATEDGLLRRELTILAESDRDLRRLLDRAGDPRLSREQRAQLDAQRQATLSEIRQTIQSGIGLPWAYERCPAYRARVESEIRVRKARSRSGDEDDQRVF